MSAPWRFLFLMMVLVTALPAAAQDFGWSRSIVPDSFPPFQPPAETTGTVSVAELRNPLRGKALDILLKAEKHLRSGETRRGMEELQDALKNPEALPYALGFLGTEHLKQSLVDTAIVELEQSVRLMSGNSATRSNLAYALLLKGKNEQGLEHARKAVQLDPGSSRARLVLAHLLGRQGHMKEALFHLRIAAMELPSARLLLEKLEPWVAAAGAP